MESKHTKGKFTLQNFGRNGFEKVIMEDNNRIGHLDFTPLGNLTDANKSFDYFLKACNAHEELLKALQRFVDFADKAMERSGEVYQSAMMREAKAALQKANGNEKA